MRLPNHPGQTLLEGIIAIAVITVGLVAVIGLAISNQASAQAIGDRAVATGLAREGLEVAKHIRDSNWIANPPQPFSHGLLDGGSSTAVPLGTFAATGPTWTLEFGGYDSFSPSETQVVWLADQMRYGHPENGGTPTKFRRRLQFDALCRPSGATGTDFSYQAPGGSDCSGLPGSELVGVRVLSHVQWPQGVGLRTVTLEMRLFDWR